MKPKPIKIESENQNQNQKEGNKVKQNIKAKSNKWKKENIPWMRNWGDLKKPKRKEKKD